MSRKTFIAAALGVLLSARAVCAATVSVSVTGDNGRPAENAVVELVAQAVAAPLAASSVPEEAVVDQRKETFLPLVSLVRKDGRVVFTNNDTTMHQVYSFSVIKQFAFEIDEGQRSQPVVFDKAGVAAVGCNIHDQMITYVYVADSPWAARTDANGHAEIEGVPAGAYRADIWHPQLVPGQSRAPIRLVVAGDSARLNATIGLTSADPRGKKRMHMQMY